MKKISIYIWSLLFVLCACTDKALMQDVQREVEVCINFSSAWSDAATKASAGVTAFENTDVQNLWVMQFDGTAGSSRLLLAKYYPTFVPGTKVKLLTSDVENYLLFIANTNNPNLEFSKCLILDDVKKLRFPVLSDTQAAGEF